MSSKNRRTERNPNSAPASFSSFFASFATITDSFHLCPSISFSFVFYKFIVIVIQSYESHTHKETKSLFKTSTRIALLIEKMTSCQKKSSLSLPSAEVYLNSVVLLSFFFSPHVINKMSIKSSFQIDIRIFEKKNTQTCHRHPMLIHVLLNNEKVLVRFLSLLSVRHVDLICFLPATRKEEVAGIRSKFPNSKSSIDLHR